MLNYVYDNLDQKKENKLILPKINMTTSTTNTYWKNVKKFLQTINRNPDHFVNFLNKEIGNVSWLTSSKSDGIVIIGKIKKEKIISNIQFYIKNYVICRICKSHNTFISKNTSSRLNELNCNKCNSIYTLN